MALCSSLCIYCPYVTPAICGFKYLPCADDSSATACAWTSPLGSGHGGLLPAPLHPHSRVSQAWQTANGQRRTPASPGADHFPISVNGFPVHPDAQARAWVVPILLFLALPVQRVLNLTTPEGPRHSDPRPRAHPLSAGLL